MAMDREQKYRQMAARSKYRRLYIPTPVRTNNPGVAYIVR